MKIAVVCACGWLYKMGYQHIYQECLGSQADFGERLYLIQSVRNSTGLEFLIDNYPGKIKHVADERTWCSENADDSNPRDFFHNSNLRLGLDLAMQDGFDAALVMHSNWYIPETNAENIRQSLQKVCESGAAFGLVYRLGQFYNRLFSTNSAFSFLVNLREWGNHRLERFNDKYTRAPMGAEENQRAIVDCPMEMPLADYEAIMNWGGYNQRNYRADGFRWDYYRDLAVRKICASKPIAGLSQTGEQIASKSRPDFISHEILRLAGYEND